MITANHCDNYVLAHPVRFMLCWDKKSGLCPCVVSVRLVIFVGTKLEVNPHAVKFLFCFFLERVDEIHEIVISH